MAKTLAELMAELEKKARERMDAAKPDSNKTAYEDTSAAVSESDATVCENDSTVPEGTSTVFESGTVPESADPAPISVEYKQGQTLLDTYRIESDPIHGGMGSVWRVHHTGWNVELAMKRPQAKVFRTEKQKEDFIHECEAWINLGLHPNIVSCYYVREIDGVPTIFSEWMENGSLEDAIRSGRLYEGKGMPEEWMKFWVQYSGDPEQKKRDGNSYDSAMKDLQLRLLDIAIQFARGLHYAHEQGLIHQDVKPDNVLLSGDFDAKVADFGLSGSAGGYTPAYCSMEQMDGKTLTKTTDIYSWAVSVLEMFMAERPWTNGVVAGLSCREYFAECRVPMPEALKELLAECMAAEAKERPGSFAEVERRLEEIYLSVDGTEYPRPASSASGNTADSLNNRALSYLDLGKKKEAAARWEAALRENPTASLARYNYTLFRYREGSLTDREADMLMHEMLSSNIMVPESPALELYGRIAMELGGQSAVETTIYRYVVEMGMENMGKRLETMLNEGRLVPDYILSQIRSIRDYEEQERQYDKAMRELRGYVENRNWDCAAIMQMGWDMPLFADLINRRDYLELMETSARHCASLSVHRDWTAHILPGASPGERLSFSADSRRLLCGERLYDVETGELISDNRCGEETRILSALSPDGSFYFRSNEDGFERVEAETGRVTERYDHPGKLNVLCISPDGQYVLSAGDWIVFLFWNLRTGEKENYLCPDGGIARALIGYDNTKILLQTKDALVRFDTETVTPEPILSLQGDRCCSIAADTGMTRVLVAMGRESVLERAGVCVLDPENMKNSFFLSGVDHNGFPLLLTGSPTKAMFSYDDTHMLYAVGGNVWTYSIQQDKPLEVHTCPGTVCDCAVSRNGKYIAISNGEKVYIKRSVRLFVPVDGDGNPKEFYIEMLADMLCSNESAEDRKEKTKNTIAEFKAVNADKRLLLSDPDVFRPYARILLSANPGKKPEKLLELFTEELADRGAGEVPDSLALAILRMEKETMDRAE